MVNQIILYEIRAVNVPSALVPPFPARGSRIWPVGNAGKDSPMQHHRALVASHPPNIKPLASSGTLRHARLSPPRRT